MLTPDFLRSEFEAGHAYDAYVAAGDPGHQESWKKFHAGVSLTAEQSKLLGSFDRTLNVLVSSGTWCGDCVQQVPMLDHIEKAAGGKIVTRYVDRDEHADLAERVKICGGLRVPVVLILNEDFDLLSLEGDRTLARYRAMAARQLGPSCPLPGAPVPPDEVAATLADWVAGYERAHLIARLSTKLRQRHGD
ncbi:MAG: thioredoxin family protein [Planctomycetota bacterium]